MGNVNLLSTIVALGILLLITAIAVTAIRRYTAEEALRVLGVLSGLFGVVTGTFVTYFFTREPIAAAERMAEVAETRAKNAELKLASLESNASDIITKFNSFPGQTSVASLRQDAHFGTYLAHAFNPTIKLETDPETGKLILKKKPLPLGTEPKPEEQKKDQ